MFDMNLIMHIKLKMHKEPSQFFVDMSNYSKSSKLKPSWVHQKVISL